MKGGAIYIETGVHPSIIVGNYSKLLFFNNNSVVYQIPKYSTVYYVATVGHDLKPQRSKGRSIETSNRKNDYEYRIDCQKHLRGIVKLHGHRP